MNEVATEVLCYRKRSKHTWLKRETLKLIDKVDKAKETMMHNAQSSKDSRLRLMSTRK